MLRGHGELWIWASALHYKYRVQRGPQLPIPLHFEYKHRALILQCHVGDCIANRIWAILLKKTSHLQLPVTKHNTYTHNEIWKQKDNHGRIIFKIPYGCWTQSLVRREHSWLWWLVGLLLSTAGITAAAPRARIAQKNCTVWAWILIWDTCQKCPPDSWKIISQPFLFLNLLYPKVLT